MFFWSYKNNYALVALVHVVLRTCYNNVFLVYFGHSAATLTKVWFRMLQCFRTVVDYHFVLTRIHGLNVFNYYLGVVWMHLLLIWSIVH